MNKKTLHTLIIIFVAIYCLSPIDCFPGPIDDLGVMVATLVGEFINWKKNKTLENVS